MTADDACQLVLRQADLGDRTAVTQQDRHHLSKAFDQPRVGIDIDVGERQLCRDQCRRHLITQVTALPGHQLEALAGFDAYSHSMVPGGLLVMS